MPATAKRSGDESVFVVFYLWAAGLGEDNRDDIKTKRAALYVVGSKKIAGGFEQSGLFGLCD